MKYEVDIVILSWAKDEELKKVTEEGIQTCIDSESDINFNFFVIESNPNISYEFPNTETIHPRLNFGYHKFMNIGVREGSAKYVCICNNDLTYEKGWASNIIEIMESNPHIKSASPWCPQTQGDNKDHINKTYMGHRVRGELAGWCIFQQRDIYETINELDEGVDFWFSDNIYADQLLINSISHVLVPKSVVNHHSDNLGKTGKTAIDEETKQKYMMGQQTNYEIAKRKLKQEYDAKNA